MHTKQVVCERTVCCVYYVFGLLDDKAKKCSSFIFLFRVHVQNGTLHTKHSMARNCLYAYGICNHGHVCVCKITQETGYSRTSSSNANYMISISPSIDLIYIRHLIQITNCCHCKVTCAFLQHCLHFGRWQCVHFGKQILGARPLAMQ